MLAGIGSIASHLDEEPLPARHALVSHTKRTNRHPTTPPHPRPEPAGNLVREVPDRIATVKVDPHLIEGRAGGIRYEHQRLSRSDAQEMPSPVPENQTVHGSSKDAGSLWRKRRH